MNNGCISKLFDAVLRKESFGIFLELLWNDL